MSCEYTECVGENVMRLRDTATQASRGRRQSYLEFSAMQNAIYLEKCHSQLSLYLPVQLQGYYLVWQPLPFKLLDLIICVFRFGTVIMIFILMRYLIIITAFLLFTRACTVACVGWLFDLFILVG